MKKFWITLLAVIMLAGLIFAYCWHNTDIPKLYLEGDISNMESKKDERSISFRYDDGEREIAGFASIKVQGTSSLAYEKKNYTLKFYTDEAHHEKLNIDVGWGMQNKYCMKANWIDHTHARNVVSAKLAGQMQANYGLLSHAPNSGAVDGFPVEIYTNGEFLGLYTFNIPKDAWTFSMDEENPNHIVVSGEEWSDKCLFKDYPDFESWSVEVGEASDETLAALNRLFDFVMNSSDAEFRAHFHEYLNLDSALNYYVFADLTWLYDNLCKNILLVTYDRQQWYLSLYDLDTSWGTTFNGYGLTEYEESLLRLENNLLFARMEQVFPEELAQRYYELRGGILSNENIMAEFEAFRDQIPTLTFMKEAIRWGNGLIRRPEDMPGRGYDQIEAYLNSVSERLDEKYAALKTKK